MKHRNLHKIVVAVVLAPVVLLPACYVSPERATGGAAAAGTGGAAGTVSATGGTAGATGGATGVTGGTGGSTDGAAGEPAVGGVSGSGGGELMTCEQVESAYQALVAGASDCVQGSDCQVLWGQCSVSLGGCYELVNRSVTQQQLIDLGEAHAELGCVGAVCDCAEPPSVGCVDGQCQAVYNEGCPGRIGAVLCAAEPPPCPPGHFPAAEGGCWTGECLHCIDGCQSDADCVGIQACGCWYHEGCGWAETVYRLQLETDPCIVSIHDGCPSDCPINECPGSCSGGDYRCCGWCDPPDAAACENGVCVEIITHMCM